MSRVSDHAETPGARPLSTVGAGVMIRGDIEGVTDLHVQGQVVGKVAVVDLVVGDHALIDGPVTAEGAVIAGCVIGDVVANTVHLTASARVEGDITCTNIQIDAGARFAGRCISNEPIEENIVPLFRHPEEAPALTDAGQELLRLAARLRRLRE